MVGAGGSQRHLELSRVGREESRLNMASVGNHKLDHEGEAKRRRNEGQERGGKRERVERTHDQNARS